MLALTGCGTGQSPGPVAADAGPGMKVEPRVDVSVRPEPKAVTSVAPPLGSRQRVRLWHCGARLRGYPRDMWELRDPRFDSTNAPDSFTGTGLGRVVDGPGEGDDKDRLVYHDDGGQRLVFVPGRLVPPVFCD